MARLAFEEADEKPVLRQRTWLHDVLLGEKSTHISVILSKSWTESVPTAVFTLTEYGVTKAETCLARI